MIRITGAVSSSQRNHLLAMTRFCWNMMMPRMKDLEITVRVKKLDVYGFCEAGDGPRLDRPREFTIELAKGLKLRDMLTTLAHEMVHVKQYARGELYEGVRANKWRWQGKYVPASIDYWDEPWEIEAHGRETGLFVRYCEKYGHSNKAWAHK